MSSMETILQRSMPQLQGPRLSCKGIWKVMQSWLQMSHTRKQLLELTDAQLEDLNLTKEAAYEEALRPFWDSNFNDLKGR